MIVTFCQASSSSSLQRKLLHIPKSISSFQSTARPTSHHSHHYHSKQIQKRIPFLRTINYSSTTTTLQSSYKNKLLDILLDPEKQQQTITSPKSKTVKFYQTISSKAKARNEHQLTIIEGHRFVIDTLSQPSIRELYKDVLVSTDALNHPKLGESLSQQLDGLISSSSSSHDKKSHNCRVHLAESNVVNAACDTVTPQGVVALVSMPKPYQFPTENEEKTQDNKKKKVPFYLILDGISDPGNVGTLIRSAKATGIEAIIILPNSCDVFSPKALRSSMGTTFQVPIISFSSWDDCYDMMTTYGIAGKEIYAATMEGSSTSSYDFIDGGGGGVETFESVPYFDVDWHEVDSRGKALIIGKEGTGLSKEVRNAFAEGDIRTIHVPMEPGIESLNAAVCGSVVMFDYHRQAISKSLV